MESYNIYDDFKHECEAFAEMFNDGYFSAGGLYCHPLLENVIYVPCTAEEQKSNGLDICRMRDMLVMSEDGEHFVPFEINKARAFAEANKFVYIATLLSKKAFKAADWMVDGKHDTVIVSVEEMKKTGKPYAPVTPLTNVTLPFKKINCPFLYSKGTLEAPKVMNKNEIDKMLNNYLADKLSDFDHIEVINETEFEIYGTTVKMDRNESRCAALDKGTALIAPMAKPVTDNKFAFDAADYDFDEREFEIAALEQAAEKCGIKHDYKSYEGKNTLDELIEQFKKNVSDSNDYGFKYVPVDKDKYMDDLAAVSLSDADSETLKKDILPLLTVRPASGAVFNLARALSPRDAENVENISEYWGVPALDTAQLAAYLESAFIPEDGRNDKGELILAPAKAKVAKEEITKAAARYKIRSLEIADKLDEICTKAEEQERTYNGTVFASVEEMNKAQENEKKLIDECDDLSALSMDELKKLRKYIYDMKLDRKTASKYLIKVRVAMNDAEENSLRQKVFGLGTKTRAELADIKKKLSESDEAIAAPYIRMVENADLSAQLRELTDAFKAIPDKAKADELEKKLDEGGYDKMFGRHFKAKINQARDGFARGEIEALCSGIETAAQSRLDEIMKKLGDIKCRAALKAPFEKKIAERSLKIEEEEAEKVFGSIASADKAKVEELRKIIADGKFRKSVTDKYVSKLDSRMTEIENGEFIKKCETIPAMDKAALDEIVKVLESGKYPAEISEKYLPRTKERADALLKAEIDGIVKDVSAMTFDKLDEAEKKLSDEKYPEAFTKDALEKIGSRRRELYRKEVDDLCRDIAKLDKKGVEELRGKLGNEKYDKEYTKKYFVQLDERIDKIETDKVSELVKDIDKLKRPELEKLAADINALGFREDNIKAGLDKIHAKEISLMKAELESLCKNIPNTPRKDLKKLKEALAGDDFDKELSAKYIEQIDKRTAELIKQELSDLCKNISASPREKLLDMKKAINETPEYAEAGKAYLDQIDNRIKSIDKAEFDKQMSEIESLDREKLDAFVENLESRKASLDPKRYEEVLKKCEEREELLAKKELDELVKDVNKLDLEKLVEIKDKIQSSVRSDVYTMGVAMPYLNKVNDEANKRYVEYYSKMTSGIAAMSRPDLIVLREKIEKNEVKAPDEMLQSQVRRVNAEIRKADRLALDAKCRNLRMFSQYECEELIRDISSMDIGEDDKREYINKCNLQITSLKNGERDSYVQQMTNFMIANGVKDGTFYIANEKGATIFEKRYQACTSSFASVGEYEPGVLIHEVNSGSTDEAYMLTLDQFYYNSKGGMDHVAIEQIERFEVKKTLFKTTLNLLDKSGKSHELPNNVTQGKAADALAAALNQLLNKMQSDKAAVKIREAEERKKVAEAKQREIENERLSIEAARRKAAEEELKAKEKAKAEAEAQNAKAEEKKPEDKPEEKKAEVAKKEFKPIQVVAVKPLPDIKPEPKPEEKKPEPKPEEKKPEPKAEEKKPEPKHEEKKPEPKPEPVKIKFCDQCGAKITNENAKFCMECGNRLIK